MKKVIITAIDRNGLEFTFVNIVLNVQEKFFKEGHAEAIQKIKNAIKSASTDYCKTDEGKRVFIGNCHNFNYGDFDTYVPNNICKKYGIEKIYSDITFDDVDYNTQLVDENNIFPEE